MVTNEKIVLDGEEYPVYITVNGCYYVYKYIGSSSTTYPEEVPVHMLSSKQTLNEANE